MSRSKTSPINPVPPVFPTPPIRREQPRPQPSKPKPAPKPKTSKSVDLLALEMLQPEQIVRIYSGRPGCACGCRGTYSVGFKPRLWGNMKAFAEKNWKSALSGGGEDGEFWLYFENETRVYTVYWRAKVSRGRKAAK